MTDIVERLKNKPEPCLRYSAEDDELRAQAAALIASQAARIRELEEGLERVLPPLRGIHGGPLVQIVATYEDSTDENTARHKGRISREAVKDARSLLSRKGGE